MDKFYEINLDRVIPSLDEGAWFVKKLFRREAKLGKRAGALPNAEKSLIFFRRKGMSMNSFEYYNFDLLVTIGIFTWLLAK